LVLDIGRLNLLPIAGDPATPSDGDIWYDDTAGLFQFREEGVTMSLSGTDAPVDATYVVTSANAELTAELVLGTDIIMAGTAAARPAAGTAGRIYFSTNTLVLERDTGAAWVVISAAAFTTLVVSGQSDVVADAINDSLTLAAGTGITITTDAATDTITITGTATGAPAAAQYVTLATHADLSAERVLTGTALQVGLTDGGANGNITLTLIDPLPPLGRLTLTTAAPVMAAEAADQTTIYYTPYLGNVASLYNGTNWIRYNVAEVSIAMAASANWAADSNFDLYLFADSGTVRLVSGAAWTNATTRSESLARLNGLWTNNASMTGRYGASSTVTVGANQGLYVGTFRTTGAAGTTTWELAGSADGGNPTILYLWNMYNRVAVTTDNFDTTNSWTYNSVTIRSKNASTTNRVTLVVGQNEEPCILVNSVRARADIIGGVLTIGWGLDSTTAFTNAITTTEAHTAGNDTGFTGVIMILPGLGMHFFQALEATSAATTGTFWGDNGGTGNHRSSLSFYGLM
jgi:hypothetical protein